MTVGRRILSTALVALSGMLVTRPLHTQAPGATGTLVNGRVVVQVFITLGDDQTLYHPVAGLPLGFFRSARDTAIAVTDAQGSATILLPPGNYRLVSLAPTRWKGVMYSWSVPVAVQPYMGAIDLRRKEAIVGANAPAAVAAVPDGGRPQHAPAPTAAAPMPTPVSPPAPVQMGDPAPASSPGYGHPGSERSRSTGFFLGLGLEGNGLVANESGSTGESGSGAGLVLGYGFTRHFSLYGELSGATMDNGSYAMAHADLGGRLHFRSGTNVVVPFVQFGVSGRAIAQDFGDFNASASGAGVSFGGGLNAHFSPSVAFSSSVTWTVGNFDDIRVNNNYIGDYSVSATSARLHLGIVWFPN
jgi:hypothetical protein